MATEPPPDGVFGYPVVLDLAGWRCLMVGGGPVASRRVRGLVASGAMVTVIAPEIADELDAFAGSVGAGSVVELVRRRYEPGEAAGYQLVLTATGDPEVDRQVVSDARAGGALVATADRDLAGTVHLPAVHRDGPVVVAVSTEGASPALARWLRDRVVESLPADVTVLAGLLDEAREAMRKVGRSTDSVDWDSAISELVPLVESGRIDEARSRLLARCGVGPG
jgi:siroheme synthase-like protein